MAREYIPVFFDWLEVTQDLTQGQKGNLIDAAILYATGGDYESVLEGVEKIAFRFIKGQIDRNAAISDARSKAGSSKKEQLGDLNRFDNQSGTNDNKHEQTESNSAKEKENKKENKKENDNKVIRRFTPPTTDEVRAYCQERGNSVDAERFVDFYTSKGWKIGKEPMKDWRAAVRTWEKEDNGRKPAKVVSAQQYTQRNYAEVGNRIMDDLDREMAQYLAKERGAG